MAIGTKACEWSYGFMFPAGGDADFAVHEGGLEIPRTFSDPDVHPFDQLQWSTSPVIVRDGVTGAEVFRDEFEAPDTWSPTARQIVCTKFAYGKPGTPGRETSARQVIGRVAIRIARWGWKQGYFRQRDDVATFSDELTYLLINQYFSFNSPVWFNVGHDLIPSRVAPEADNWRNVDGTRPGGEYRVWSTCRNENIHKHPQVHACFIQGVDDSISGIMDLAKSEAIIFKYGSGTGTDLSTLRSTGETLTGGGTPSGPISFMRIYDAVAGTIKSGGKSRRAAKMQTLKCWHPDILDFVRCKSAEEKKARALIAAGYPSDFNGDAYSTVAFQNCNMSVRLTDEFMESATADVPPTRNIVSRLFPLRAVKTGEIVGHVDADELLTEIAKGSHFCGDPAVQFEDRFQEWHTTPNAGPINSTNPCLSGQTLVDTVEGPVCVADLARRHAAGESIPMVFCWDRETDIPAIRPVVRAFKTKDTDRMVDVVTRKGLTFRVTPDHPFLLPSGRYVAASDLKIGARLRKIGRWANEKRRGDRYINHRETQSVPSGTVRESRWIWEQVYGPIPDGFETHHKDEDTSNNRLSNLELKRSGIHQSEHSSGRSNPRFIDADESLLVRVWDAVADTGDVTVSRWNAEVRRSGLVGKVPIARYRDGVGLIRGVSWYEFTAEVEAIRDRVNDRVESVTPVLMESPIPVYDLTVMGTANFAAFGHDRKGDHLHSIILKNCGEYASIDESGCNLASHRLTKFESDDGTFDVDRYCAAIDLSVISQDIVIDPASYPTAKIAENVRRHRQLGLGYADLGALLMSRGLPYDSDEGRHLCSAITSLMTARAYRMSASLAKHRGAFDAYAADEANMMRVISKHESASIESGIDPDSEAGSIMGRACGEWGAAIDIGNCYGFRNSQATLLAPTGTIGYMMDCDTLGIEPDTALVKFKHLAGGGDMTIVNRAVGRALDRLGYDPTSREFIVDHVERHGDVVAPGGGPWGMLRPEHMDVFDCAIPTGENGRSIAPMGHVKMMAAAQPFVSGAISKTVNLPESSTVDDIKQIYVDAWKMGLKSITVYRDGSKYSQPVATSAPVAGRNGSLEDGGTSMDSGWSVTDKTNGEARSIPFIDVEEIDVPPDREPIRRRLPDRRKAVVHHFEIAGAHGNFDGYITVGLYDDGRPGEIFMASGKGGSTLDGMLKVIGTMTSMLLQYGVPIEVLSRKFAGIGFEPAGPTRTDDVRHAKSIVDYVFKWVALNFSEELKLEWTPSGHAPTIATATTGHVCGECGSANLAIEGRCWRCLNCLWVSGGCGG